MGWPIRHWIFSVSNWPTLSPLSFLCKLLLPLLSFSFFFPLSFLFFLTVAASLLKPFAPSDLCTCRLRSSETCRLVDVDRRGSERGTVASGGAKRPLGDPQLSGEIPDNSTVGLLLFHFHSISRELRFPSISRSTVESCQKFFLFFVQSKMLTLDLGQSMMILEVIVPDSYL